MLYTANLPFGTITRILGIAYENFGLVRFQVANDGSVPALEWWKNIFTRTEA